MTKVKIASGTYTTEFREDAVRLVTWGDLAAGRAAESLSMPKPTLERWIKAAKGGNLNEKGKS